MAEQTAAGVQKQQSQQVVERSHRQPARPRSGRTAGSLLALQRRAGNRAVSRLVEERLLGQAVTDEAAGLHPLEAPLPANRRTPEAHPLGPRPRARLERRYGRSLEGMQVQTGAEGREMASRYRALAVSIGDVAYFNRGAYAPGTGRGDRILAHEAAHYLQRHADGRGSGPAWSEAALEAEAHIASSSAPASASSPTSVFGKAPAALPLFMKTYISTVGGNPYLEAAVKFYKLWENETAIRISSYQEIVEKLAAEKNPLPQFRIVSHGSGLNLFLPLLSGAKEYASLPALGMQTREALAGELGSAKTGVHLSADMVDTVLDWVKGSTTGKSLLQRLGIKTSPKGSLREWVWWAVDEYYADKDQEQKPEKGGPRGTNVGERQALKAEVAKFQSAIGSAAEAVLPTGASRADLEVLRSEVLKQLSDRKWSWNPPAGYLKGQLDRMRLGDVVALRRELTGGFLKSLAAVKSWVNGTTYIEIRGCKIGENDNYLKGIQAFFGSKPDRLPSISAPKLYQFFGKPAVTFLPTGGKNPPAAGSLQFLYEETFGDSSTAKEIQKAIRKARLQKMPDLATLLRTADIKAEFEAWWEMKQKAKGVAQAKIQTATLKDIQDFLTTAPPRTFPINTQDPDAKQSLWFFILLTDTAVEAVLNWVQDQGYRLPGGKDPLQEFFGGKKEFSNKRFGAGHEKLWVDWLGDTYPAPKKIYFPEDPHYKQNIRKLPGSGKSATKQAPAKPKQGGGP